MIRVYVAGPISSSNSFQFLANVGKGIKMSLRLLLDGYSPFSPFLDFQYFLLLPEGQKVSIEVMYAYSMAWLEVSNAVLVLEGWENSVGTKAEIARANMLGIPVFFSYDELEEYKSRIIN
jgi:hypothetical protein